GRAPVVCKCYVLEHSTALAAITKEHEDDINLLVAIPLPLLLLMIGYAYRYPLHHLWMLVGVTALMGGYWYVRMKRICNDEVREWLEMFLLLRMQPKEIPSSPLPDHQQGDE